LPGMDGQGFNLKSVLGHGVSEHAVPK
jgi:hypothetical protein